MKIKSLFLIYILSVMMVCTAHAQSSADLLACQNESLSPSEQRFNRYAEDMDVLRLNTLYSNPSYYEWTHTHDSLCHVNPYRSLVYTGYASGKLEGDYLMSEGNAFNDFRLGGSGEFSLRHAGILFGRVRYARGTHKNISWNAVRHPDLYAPYFSTDSIGGDFRYEDYLVEGGYAFTLGGWKLGVKGHFHGEQAHRKTDPRALNKTTWLNFGIGASHMFHRHLFMLDASFGINKQHMDLRYWRPGQQDRFFVCYSFGLYDIRRSKVSFGYSRMHYLAEAGARFTYQSPIDKPFSVLASLAYDFDRMKTEETDICDLYYTQTHTLSPTVRFDWHTAAQWTFSLSIDGKMDMRKGHENIFERYVSDVDNNIYDYRKVDEQQNYNFNRSDFKGQFRAGWQITPRHYVGFLGGAAYASRCETYMPKDMKVENASVFPHGEVSYRWSARRSELDLAFLCGRSMPVVSVYDVSLKSGKMEYLDFQHAFAPYAYYNASFVSLNATASYTYHFSKCALGVNARFMFVDGKRDADTSFTHKIGYASSAPMISTLPDIHDERWGSASLFLVF